MGGQPRLLRKVICAGADLHAMQKRLDNPLQLGSLLDKLVLLQPLDEDPVFAGIQLGSTGAIALGEAMCNDHLDVAEFLINMNVQVDDRLILQVLLRGTPYGLDFLIRRATQFETSKQMLRVAVRNKSKTRTTLMLQILLPLYQHEIPVEDILLEAICDDIATRAARCRAIVNLILVHAPLIRLRPRDIQLIAFSCDATTVQRALERLDPAHKISASILLAAAVNRSAALPVSIALRTKIAKPVIQDEGNILSHAEHYYNTGEDLGPIMTPRLFLRRMSLFRERVWTRLAWQTAQGAQTSGHTAFTRVGRSEVLFEERKHMSYETWSEDTWTAEIQMFPCGQASLELSCYRILLASITTTVPQSDHSGIHLQAILGQLRGMI
ncbi:hypothetical protein MMC25_004102 [Agyrium rufum]|nr:hypothetical protein [Agyrium rufum]